MPRYIRAKGSVFFFTVVLAERPSKLLLEEIERLRQTYRAVQQRRPFQTIAVCVLPNHIHAIWGAAGGRRRFLRALELDQERLFTRLGLKTAIHKQGR